MEPEALHSSTGQEIRRYMEENPSESFPHGVLADYLEHNGMPAHAEIMRLAHGFNKVQQPIGNTAGTFVKEHSGHAHKSTLFHGDYDTKGHLSVKLKLPAVGRNGHFEYTVGGLPAESAKHLHEALIDEGAQKGLHTDRPYYAWPGGYQMLYYTQDGGVLCPECANGLNGSESDTEEGKDDPQWKVTGQEPYYEGATIQCDHCGQDIESAHGDPHYNRRYGDD